MSTTAAGLSVTTVTTDQQAPLGFILEVPTADQGLQEWIYVQNASGAPLAAAKMQTRAAGSATYSVAEAGGINPAQAVGVVVTAIPDGSFGFLLRKGIATVDAAGAVTANSGLILVAAGEVTHAAAITGQACGNTLAGVGGAGTFTAFVNCKG
jgi:hypothetical protein